MMMQNTETTTQQQQANQNNDEPRYGSEDGRQLMVVNRANDEQLDQVMREIEPALHIYDDNNEPEPDPDLDPHFADEWNALGEEPGYVLFRRNRLDDLDLGYESDCDQDLTPFSYDRYVYYNNNNIFAWLNPIDEWYNSMPPIDTRRLANRIANDYTQLIIEEQFAHPTLTYTYAQFREILNEELGLSVNGPRFVHGQLFLENQVTDLSIVRNDVIFSVLDDPDDPNLTRHYYNVIAQPGIMNLDNMMADEIATEVSLLEQDFYQAIAITTTRQTANPRTYSLFCAVTDERVVFFSYSYTRDVSTYYYDWDREDNNRDPEYVERESQPNLYERILNPPLPRNEPQGVARLEPQDELGGASTGDVNEVDVHSSENVDLIENRGYTLAEPMPIDQPSVLVDPFTISPSEYSDLCDRFNNIGSFTWDISQEPQTIIDTLDLPIDVVRLLSKNPATLPLEQHCFWTPEFTLRYQLNSTKFHAGMLVVGVMYYAKTDSHTPGSRTPASSEKIWQLDYATLNAASSDVVELHIPFQSYLDRLPIRDGDIGSTNYYATAYVGVVSPLRIKEGNTSVTVARQVQMSCQGRQTRFYGQISRTPVFASTKLEPQDLIGKATKAVGIFKSQIITPVESLFKGFGALWKTVNEDKPMDPVEAQLLLETPSVSLSWGAGATRGRSMRIDPTCLTPHHPETVPATGDSLATPLQNKWGYVNTFSFNVNSPVNTLIGTLPITPMQFCNVKGGGTLPTPMAGVAGCFTQFTGRIKFLFKIVKAGPQSVRLRFSSIPGSEVPPEDMVDYPSTIQDFEETTEFEYVPPYYGSTKLTPISIRDQIVHNGLIQIRLENLVSNISICTDIIDLVVLAKANDDLQLSIPRPVYWRPTGKTIIPEGITLNMRYPNGVKPVRVPIELYRREYGKTSWELIDRNFDTRTLEVRSGSIVWDYFVTPANNPVVLNLENVPYYYLINYYGTAVNRIFTSEQTNDQGEIYTVNGQQMSIHGYDPLANLEKLGRWDVTLVANVDDPEVWPFEPTIKKRLRPQDEREEDAPENGPKDHSVVSPSSLILGEEFSMRDMLRRYMPIISEERHFATAGEYKYVFDINYGSAAARQVGEQVTTLTWCHDGYRFAKGGMNYNIVIDHASSPVKMRAYHVPGGIRSDFIITPQWTSADNIAIGLNAYAHEVVATSSTSIPIHVPYYNHTKFLVNGYNPEAQGYMTTAAYSFGQLEVVVDVPANTDLHMTIHRALADDAELYTFQGWPTCVNAPEYLNLNRYEPIPTTTKLEPQDVVLEKQHQPQIDLAQCYSRLIAEYSTTRRGRKALKKFFSKHSKYHEPQDEEEIDEGTANLITGYLQRLAEHYMAVTAVTAHAPYPVLSVITEGDVQTLREGPLDNPVAWKQVVVDVATKILSAYPTVEDKFFKITNLERPSFNWRSYMRSALRSCTETLPASVLAGLSKQLDESLYNIPSKMVNILSSLISSVSKIAVSDGNLFTFVTNIQMIICANETWVKAAAFTSVLAMFGLLSPKQMAISWALCTLMSFNSRKGGYVYLYPQDDAAELEEHRSALVSFLSAIMAGACALAGFSGAKTWTDGIESFIRTIGTVGNSWYTLLSKSCTFIVDYLLYLFGHSTPAASAAAELADLNIDINDWVSGVLEVTKPSDHDKVINSPALRCKVSLLYEQGSAIIKLLNQTDNRNKIAQVPVFLSLWKKLSDIFQETGMTPDSIMANMSPICIWISGPPGVGKSNVAKHLAVELATLMGISFDGDPVFVRTPRKYWDGYLGNPIILFDDVLQVQTPSTMESFYSDWYGVMTNAGYSPEFSRTEEKTKFITPRIVICCGNQAFPTPNGVASTGAFYRRRDWLLECDFSQEMKDNYPGIKTASDLRVRQEDRENFKHLVFKQYANPGAIKANEQKEMVPKSFSKDELLKVIAPQVMILDNERIELAKKHVALCGKLRPENIAKERDMILERINATDLLKETADTVTAAVMTQIPQDEVERGVKPYRFNPSVESFCLEECAGSPVDCFCNLTSRQILDSEFCPSCGVFFTRKGGKVVLLGDAKRCDSKKVRDANFDHCLRTVQKKWEEYPCAELIPLPEPRNLSVVKKVVRRLNLNQFGAWLAATARPLWQQLPLRYLLPIGVCFALFYLCKFTSMIDRLKKYFGILTGQNPQGTTETLNAFAKTNDRSYSFTDGMLDGDRIGPWVYKASTDTWEQDTAWINPLSPQIASSGSVTTARSIPRARFSVQRAQDEAQTDIVRQLTRNRAHITVTWSNGFTNKSFGVGLCDRNILFPKHTFQRWAVENTIVSIDLSLSGVHTKGGMVTLLPGDWEIISVGTTDMVVFKAPCRIPQFRNITKAFISAGAVSNASRKGMLYNVLGDDIQIPKVSVVDIRPEAMRVCYALDKQEVESDLLGFSYPLESNGMCGSILIDKIRGTIIGMHVSGDNNGRGYAAALVKEDFDFLKPTLEGVEEPILEAGGSVTPKGEFIPIGRLPQDQCVTLPLTSQIAKASSFGVLTPPVRAPVRMIEPGEAVPGLTNLTLAVEKGGFPSLPWSRSEISRAVDDLQAIILDYAVPTTTDVGVRTFEEAIVGVPNVPFMDPLKRGTSVGWPLCVSGYGTKKESYIDYLETESGLRVNGVHPELVRIYTANHEKRRNGEIPFSPYMTFLKDERLKPGKRPRPINGCPIDQTIDFRRYVLDFCAAVQSCGRDPNVGIAVGINVHGPEWSQLARDLLSVGDSIACGDYSGFGPGLDPELVLACCEITNAWYHKYQNVDLHLLPEDDVVRMTLFENLAFSHEVSKDTVLQTLCGSPSGNPYTVLINSMVNLLYIRLCWLRVFQGTVLEDLSHMRKLMRLFVYGDDLIMSLAPEILPFFNNVIISKVLATQGITYTDADKSGRVRPYHDLSEATFLKCYFYPHPTRGAGFFLAALEKPMIEDIPNWVRKPYNDLDEVSLANSRECVRLAYAWGKEYYGKIKAILKDYWASRGLSLDVESWDYLDQLYFGELRGITLPKSLDPSMYNWI